MDGQARAWFEQRSAHWRDWVPEQLVERKRQLGLQVSVVIPARNEERTVGGVVSGLSRALVSEVPLVDELLVIDSDSADRTAEVAAAAGAAVFRARDIAPELGSFPGKGEALWKSLLVSSGDLLVFMDADLTCWGPHFVRGLLGPLLTWENVRLVKGHYERGHTDAGGSALNGAGRVTELVARPLLSLWWPELTGVVQPLAGEWAVTRSLMESLPVPVGYGVELAVLLDTASRYGLDALAQVDLGARAHRHQADHDLAVMAAELLLVAERRRRGPGEPGTLPGQAWLQQFGRDDGGVSPRSRVIPSVERPPAGSVHRAVPV